MNFVLYTHALEKNNSLIYVSKKSKILNCLLTLTFRYLMFVQRLLIIIQSKVVMCACTNSVNRVSAFFIWKDDKLEI